MDIAWVASEMAPFSKTGGLADVAGALPKALAARGHRVLAISPRYKAIDGAVNSGVKFLVRLFGVDHLCELFVLDRDGVRWVLVDNPCYHRGGIYGDETGAYDDNLFRYALLSRAAIEAVRFLPAIDGRPMADDTVFHANDWHTGLLPVYLQGLYQPRGVLRRLMPALAAACVLVVATIGVIVSNGEVDLVDEAIEAGVDPDLLDDPEILKLAEDLEWVEQTEDVAMLTGSGG